MSALLNPVPRPAAPVAVDPPPSRRKWWIVLLVAIVGATVAWKLASDRKAAEEAAAAPAFKTVAVTVGLMETRMRIAGQTSYVASAGWLVRAYVDVMRPSDLHALCEVGRQRRQAMHVDPAGAGAATPCVDMMS